jgi:ATP-dependent Zn protease
VTKFKLKRRTTLEERTAYHEAGHFVAAYVGKRSPAIRHLSIVPKGDTLGHVLPFPTPSFRPDIDPQLQRVVDTIVIYLAGSAAEKRFAGRVDHGSSEEDYGSAVSLGMHVVTADRELELFVNWLDERAAEVIDLHWWAVRAVAEALMVRKKMTGKEAREVIDGVAVNGRAR